MIMSHVIILKCSKQGSKRAKKQHIAVLAATVLQVRQKRAIRISDGVPNSPATMPPISEGVSNPTHPKGKASLVNLRQKKKTGNPGVEHDCNILAKERSS